MHLYKWQDSLHLQVDFIKLCQPIYCGQLDWVHKLDTIGMENHLFILCWCANRLHLVYYFLIEWIFMYVWNKPMFPIILLVALVYTKVLFIHCYYISVLTIVGLKLFFPHYHKVIITKSYILQLLLNFKHLMLSFKMYIDKAMWL